MTTASRTAPLAVRTGRVMRAARSRRSSSLSSPPPEGREQLLDGQRTQVVEAVAEQLDGALVAPGEALGPPPTVSATRMARLSLTVAL